MRAGHRVAWPKLADDARSLTSNSPPEVGALHDGVTRLLDALDPSGRKVGDCTCGVYLFTDYDGEPIYVGQTKEKLRTRIRRHLTNQRTDAVAMRVLDPFEVAEIEMWPFWDLAHKDVGDTLDRAEYTVYRRALSDSKFNAVLNEVEITETELVDLPEGVSGYGGIIGSISCDAFGDCGVRRIAVVEHLDSGDPAATRSNTVYEYNP